MPRTLADWLTYQEQIHPAGIALGLERVREVAGRLDVGRPASNVITVAGTNGKGSTVAFIDAIARAAGYRVGCFTSPHLLRYNERVRIDGVEVDDDALIAAFERIEAARAEVPLTYFEFGTLAALIVLGAAGLDLAVLEVGLGGRLDAVNLIDADVALLTTVAFDHMEWLGRDLEAIGHEKAGVFRAGRPAVIGERAPPRSVLAHAAAIGAPLRRAGIDFDWSPRPDGGFDYRDEQGAVSLPAPGLVAGCQPANASAAICALRQLGARLPVAPAALVAGVATARVVGRMQRLSIDAVELVLDVAHNPQAAGQLAAWLDSTPAAGRTLAVFSALGDKDIPALLAPLRRQVDRWWLAGLPALGGRGLGVDALRERVAGVLDGLAVASRADVGLALAGARAEAGPGDRIVVFGSFHTVAAALQALPGSAAAA
jgi:dihydrofolate synthase / folylpolyglutamate synthase